MTDKLNQDKVLDTAQEQTQQTSREKDEKTKFAKKPGGKPVRRKPCAFCFEKSVYIDYKDIARLKKYVTENGKLVPRRQSGLCAGHQRELTAAIKRARVMSLL